MERKKGLPFRLYPFSPCGGESWDVGKVRKNPAFFSFSFPYALLALASCLVFSLAFRVAFPSPHCGRELG